MLKKWDVTDRTACNIDWYKLEEGKEYVGYRMPCECWVVWDSKDRKIVTGNMCSEHMYAPSLDEILIKRWTGYILKDEMEASLRNMKDILQRCAMEPHEDCGGEWEQIEEDKFKCRKCGKEV
jgi:hypothetical protein